MQADKDVFKVPRILVVDDEKDEVDILVELVESEGYRAAAAHNGEEALTIARKGDIDVILLDVVMPGRNGYEVCEELKSDDRTRDVPVIFITVKGAVEEVTGGLDLGAHDYITKPYDIPIVMARVRAALRAKKLQDSLRLQNVELRDQTYTDELTGLRNARFFHERLDEEADRAALCGFPLSCVMIEMDAFREVDDHLGEAHEEDIIGELAMILKTNSRSFDAVSRSEGAQFWALMPHISLEDALSYAEKVRSEVEETLFSYPSAPSKVSIHIGVCSFSGNQLDGKDLLQGARSALAKAKRNRKKRVVGNQLSVA